MKNIASLKKSKGFTIVELLIVLAIIAVLAVVGVPMARGIIVGGKTEPTASDINKIVAKMRANFSGQGTTPYVSVNTAVFANTGRGLASALTVAGNGAAATITHDIGATASPLTIAPANISVNGDSFAVTVPAVNEAACPGLAAQLSRSAEIISINGVNVKGVGTAMDGAAGQNACTADDTNTFVFTFR